MSIQDTYDKAVEIAKENDGEFSHINTFLNNKHMWVSFNFQDNKSVDEFIYELHTNNIGLVVNTPNDNACEVLI